MAKWQRHCTAVATALRSCPCGCRNFPFTDERLAKGGLHGLLVRLAGHAKCGTSLYPSYRHVHPDELALLCGMRPGFKWDEPKLALCALGQLASPLQSAWMGAFIRQHVHSRFGRSPVEQPTLVLLKFMEKLLNARDQVFGVPAKHSTKVFAAMVSQRTFVMPAISYEAMESPIQHDGEMESKPTPVMPTAAPEVKDCRNPGDDESEIAAAHASAPATHVRANASVGPAPRVFHEVRDEDSVGHPNEDFPCRDLQFSAREDIVNVTRDPNAAMVDGTRPNAGPMTVLLAPRTPGITATPGYQNAGFDMSIQGKGTTPMTILATEAPLGHVPTTDALPVPMHPLRDFDAEVNMPAEAIDQAARHVVPVLPAVVTHHDHEAAESPPHEAGPTTVPEALRTPGITATPGDQNAGLEQKQMESSLEKQKSARFKPSHLAHLYGTPRPTINPTLQRTQIHESEQAKRAFAVPDQFGGVNGFEANKRRKHDRPIQQPETQRLQLSSSDQAHNAFPHPHQAGPKTVPRALRTPGITATPGDQNAGMEECPAKINHEHSGKTKADGDEVRDEPGPCGAPNQDMPNVATQIEEEESRDPTPLVEEHASLPCESAQASSTPAPAQVTVWLLSDQAQSPLEVVASSIATPRQLLQAELKMNPTDNVVYLRS
eukprot:s1625_g9.t1